MQVLENIIKKLSAPPLKHNKHFKQSGSLIHGNFIGD